jgi:hypothetical protein
LVDCSPIGRVDNKQVSKLLLHIVYLSLPASVDTGQGYAEVYVSQTSRMHFNKFMPVCYEKFKACLAAGKVDKLFTYQPFL